MRLSTLAQENHPDGRLVVVSADHRRCVSAAAIAATLQQAMENWSEAGPQLEQLSQQLNTAHVAGEQEFEPTQALAPLPRSWQWLDASAFESHGRLMSKVFGMDDPPRDRPLMYQGVSNPFYGPCEPVPFRSEADGIDFEGEFGVIVDEVPMGVTPDQAMQHIRLVVQINDWSLRVLAPVEMKTGFGWVQAKPPCSAAPVAVSPEELGSAWNNGRVALDLLVDWNGKRFGAANGEAMSFGFHELVAHAAATRSLVAGTIIGSGTVSNENYREIGSSCIAERRGIEIIDQGKPKTEFMKFGDRVRMEATDLDDGPLFGVIDQEVVRA
ncbi:MAG TPA: fumarylacetoacetate hydrolase family protein [Xanthomonadales bacterium]|nr:fumarylacetoacetate hydrolase family protein [Xanthomonadales bacterium]